MWEHLSLQVRRSGVRTIGWIQPVDSFGRVLGVARRTIGKAPACGRWCWQKLTAFKIFGCEMYQRKRSDLRYGAAGRFQGGVPGYSG